jgi:malate dehydrogenase (oxaloacetate-decarboxylating)(NADP+)
LKELNKVDSIGPIMLGLSKPVHIFQLGASVEEMVNMTAIAAIDAQEKQKKSSYGSVDAVVLRKVLITIY